MRYELIRYFWQRPHDIVMRPKSFLTNQEVSPYQGGGPEAIFIGDTLDLGAPAVGSKFSLSNQFLPLAEGEERKAAITSPVIWVEAEKTYAIAPYGTIQHAIDFRTKYSEYRLTWLTR